MQNPTTFTAENYYPFGMVMPGRSYTSSGGDYRFGFNGMEKDGEDWTGSAGNQLDFGARIYDSRLGQLLSIDPLFKKFPHESPYLFSGNNPILYKDIEGKEKTITTIIISPEGNKTVLVAKNDNEVKISIRTLGGIFQGVFAVQDIRQTITIDFRDNPEGVTTVGREIYSEPYRVGVGKFAHMQDEKRRTEGGGYAFTSAKFEGGGEIRTVPLENLEGIVNIDDLLDLIAGNAPSGKGKMLENMSNSSNEFVKSAAKLTDVMEKVFEGADHLINISVGLKEFIDRESPVSESGKDTVVGQFNYMHERTYVGTDTTIDKNAIGPAPANHDFEEVDVH